MPDNKCVAVLEEEHARRAQIQTREAPRLIDICIHDLRVILTPDPEGHNFFDPQPTQQEDVSVFLLSKVLHNWVDEHCLTILKHLRTAAGPETQLVIIKQLMAYACDEPTIHDIPGAELPVPPKPLLPNFGRATMMYGFDVLVRRLNPIHK